MSFNVMNRLFGFPYVKLRLFELKDVAILFMMTEIVADEDR